MNSLLSGLAQIVTHTPWWVALILVGLLIGGTLRLKSRPTPVASLLIAPFIYAVWGLGSLAARASNQPALVLPWLAAGLLGAGLGWLMAPPVLHIDREHKRVHLPGSANTLIAGLAVFVLKYACNVAAAIRPEDRALIAMIDMAVSGASAGYFWSGLVRVLLRYRSAPSPEVRAETTLGNEPSATPVSA